MKSKLQMKLLLGVSLLFSFLVLTFQNCDRVSHSVQFSGESDSKSAEPSEGGQQYDGKIYVLLGALCSDGTQVQSKIVIDKTSTATLVRENCQDITPVVLAASQYQLQNSNQVIYQGQNYFASANGSFGAGYGTLPKLVSPVDPTAYGAVGDGVTDNTAAFTAALAAGDLLIPAGDYVLNGTVRIPAGRNVQCASLTSVKIRNPIISSKSIQTFQFGANGGSLSNCHVVGSDSLNSNGSATYDSTMVGSLLVGIVDYSGPVSNIQIVNNVFENCHADGCVQIYGGATGDASNNQIKNNTFNNCGYFGVLLSGSKTATVSRNYLGDCSMGVQNNSVTQPNFNNVFDSNYLTVTHGTGMYFSKGIKTALSGGGGPYAADYSTNVVSNNTLVGNGTPGSLLLTKDTTYPAQYLNNSCTNGCTEF